MAVVTGSAASPRVLSNQALTAGNSYYIMVDTWPTPNCIPSFSLDIIASPPPPPGSTCALAINYGNVNDPAVSGSIVAYGSRWYTFTNPSPNDISVIASLCGSGYDTKLDIYTACDVPYSYTNDDFCGLQSSISFVLPAGQSRIAKVYGYQGNFGAYTLSITALIPPDNDNCANAQSVTGPYPEFITGTTINATLDCPGILDWNAVWYEIDLPYPINDLSISFCGNNPPLADLGIVYYNDCSICDNYQIFSYAPCDGGWDLTAPGIPGPATIFFPAYVGPTGRDFQFFVDVIPPGPSELPLSNWALVLGGLLIGAFSFIMIRRRF